MERIERVKRLLALLENTANKYFGEDSLQNVVFILQQRGIDYGQIFQYEPFGVYSKTLRSDIEWAEQQGTIKRELNNGSNRLVIRDLGKSLLRNCGMECSHFGDSISYDLIPNDPTLLQAVSTIIYFKSSFYSEDRINLRLGNLLRRFPGEFGAHVNSCVNSYFKQRPFRIVLFSLRPQSRFQN